MRARVDLPQPLSPTTARVRPGATAEGDAVHRPQLPAPAEQALDRVEPAQAVRLEDGHASGNRQRATPPGTGSSGTGLSQTGWAWKQRGAKTQPGGRSARPGTTPGMVGRRARGSACSRQAGEQGGGVGVARARERFGRGPDLHALAGVHHLQPPGCLGDDGHVVGDQDQGHAALALERGQEVEHLLLDGDVERGGGLVGDQELAGCRRSPWRS